MSLERLIAALEEEARAQADAVLEEARREADRIRRDAREEADRRRAELLEAREAEWRREAERAAARARQEGRAAVLRARAALLERIRRRVLQGLGRDEAVEAFREALPGYVVEALRPLAGRHAVVTSSPELAPELRASLQEMAPDDLQVEVHPEEGAPIGFRLRSGDGRLEVDATLPELLERAWPEIAVELTAEAADRTGAGIP